MKLNILLFAFCLGILLGVTVFTQPAITGEAVECYAENELCKCDDTQCICGERTVPLEYCYPTQPDGRA